MLYLITLQLIQIELGLAKIVFHQILTPYTSIDDFSGNLGKTIFPSTIQPIRIIEKDGQIYTLDNRRLYAYQQAGIDIPYQKLDHIPKRELFKFSIENEGISIILRPRKN